MLFCLAPIREAVKYENQISQGLIEQEAEKTQSFIHEFVLYYRYYREEFRTFNKSN